jgi:predicted phosphohydrolase
MAIVWLSDLHLDRAAPSACARLHETVRRIAPKAAIVTGDTSHAKQLIDDLSRLADTVRGPVYMVLGNHDHYGSSVGAVRDALLDLGERRPEIRWLPPAGVVSLPDGRRLIGVDGWADGRHGDPLTTPVTLNDDRLIAELAAEPTRIGKLAVRRVLADADAARLDTLLDRAVTGGANTILVATHVPPFVECLPPGRRIAHPHWHPVLVCGATGTVLRRYAAAHPTLQFEVLAGHSHQAAEVEILPNLRVRVAGARYGQPQVQGTL